MKRGHQLQLVSGEIGDLWDMFILELWFWGTRSQCHQGGHVSPSVTKEDMFHLMSARRRRSQCRQGGHVSPNVTKEDTFHLMSPRSHLMFHLMSPRRTCFT
eukprot:1143319-Pelagomonas_calceolata.AAC.2